MPADQVYEQTFLPTTRKYAMAAGGAAGAITVTGIRPEDELVAVLNVTDGGNLTSEFTITADNTIDNTGGTATTGDFLLVIYDDVPEDIEP